MSDTARPGEVDLETHTPEAVVETAVAVAEPEAVVEEIAAEPEADPVAEDTAPAPKKHTGAVAELIANRRALKEANERLARYESNPAIQRLTPEMQQAIIEGRVHVQPPQARADLEKERLGAVAEKFGLYKANAAGEQVPDLETAKRVAAGIREIAAEEVAPLQRERFSEKATNNRNVAVQFATSQKMPAEAVTAITEAYDAVLRQPNGAKLLADATFSTELWHSTIGRLWSGGKLTGAAASAAAEAAPVIVTEAAGRRGPAAGSVTLSPTLQKVYREGGLDPTATTKQPQVDSRGHMQLED